MQQMLGFSRGLSQWARPVEYLLPPKRRGFLIRKWQIRLSLLFNGRLGQRMH